MNHYIKQVKIVLIISLVILIGNASNANDSKYKVIKVIDGDTFYVDFNSNGIAEKDEKVRVNGVDTFEVKPTEFLNYQIKNYGLTQDEALGLGYLGKEFAKKHLLNKYVEVKYTGMCEPRVQPETACVEQDDVGRNYQSGVGKTTERSKGGCHSPKTERCDMGSSSDFNLL